MSKIYTVTALVDPAHRHLNPGMSASRCFGWFPTRAEAEEAIYENRADMHELLYGWIVLEEYNPGIHPDSEQLQWYKWDKGHEPDVGVGCSGGWAQIDQPEFSKNIVNFALG